MSQIVPVFRNVIIAEQDGFCEGRLTVSNLAIYTGDLAFALDSGLQVDAIYRDFSKAFDRMNHVILLAKLQALSITGPLLRWMGSYLTGRTQRVNIKDTYSGLFAVTSDVPQKSHLGPLLFKIFVNDIGAGIINSKFLLFAHDLKLYRAIESPNDALLLQGDLTHVAE